MKKILLLVMWLSITITSFSQQITPSEVPTREYYLKKSDHQHTAALVLLIGGGCLVVGSIIWATSKTYDNNDLGLSGLDAPGALALGGIAAMISSIPLFIFSRHNAKKARDLAVYFKYTHSIPGLSVKIKL